MNWKIFVLLLGFGVLTSCGGGPKADAKKVCNCGKEIISMLNSNASEKDIEAKWDECSKLHNDLEAKYKDDADKLKEFDEAGKECSKELDAEMDAAVEKWQKENNKEN
jgi:Skp family chaperone for outer membrane proteins